jgi:hypothetical protein
MYLKVVFLVMAVAAATLIFANKLLNPWPPIFMQMKRLYYIMWNTEVRGKLCWAYSIL